MLGLGTYPSPQLRQPAMTRVSIKVRVIRVRVRVEYLPLSSDIKEALLSSPNAND